jgi:hypothetical protein
MVRSSATWRRIIGAKPEGLSEWDESSWQRSAADTSAFAGRAIPFMLICGPIFGAAGANLFAFDSIVLRSLVGATCLHLPRRR